MSQMGKVIKEVNKLFNDRGEQVLAERRSPLLFEAAKDFKREIDNFEVREKEKRNDPERVTR